MHQLSIVQVSGPGSKSCLLCKPSSYPELIQLMLYAQPHCPAAEGTVKGVGNVQHNLDRKAQLICMLSLTPHLLS